jgi:uncharacterized protein (TIGR00252 family)
MSTEVGRRAEDAAAHFLQARGYRVCERNWRTRWCEIDIVAVRDSITYFVEVKYRGNTTYGGGLDYITPKKLAQMQFAAEFWCARNQAAGDYRLAAVELTGPDYTVSAWLDDV